MTDEEIITEVLRRIRLQSRPVTQLPVGTALDETYSLPVTKGTTVFRLSIPAIITAVATLLSGQNYLWGGAAGPSTNPGTPAYGIVYEASVVGQYTHFLDSEGNPIVVSYGEVARLRWAGTYWVKEATDYVSKSFFHVVSESQYEANKATLDATDAIHFIFEEDS